MRWRQRCFGGRWYRALVFRRGCRRERRCPRLSCAHGLVESNGVFVVHVAGDPVQRQGGERYQDVLERCHEASIDDKREAHDLAEKWMHVWLRQEKRSPSVAWRLICSLIHCGFLLSRSDAHWGLRTIASRTQEG